MFDRHNIKKRMGKQAQITCHTPTTTPLTRNDTPFFQEEQDEPSQAEEKPNCSPCKSKKIAKGKVSRVFNPEDRFLNRHIERYYLFPFHYSQEHPYFRISWKNWKPNGIYKKMADFLSNLGPSLPDKTPNQCKSYD